MIVRHSGEMALGRVGSGRSSLVAVARGDRTVALRALLGQFLRYGVVGGVAFVADMGTLLLLAEAWGWHYLVAAASGFSVGVLVNYVLSTRWVFERRADLSWGAEFLGFALIGVLGLAWNEIAIWVCVEVVGVHYGLAKLVATGLVFLWNFFGRKYLVFS